MAASAAIQHWTRRVGSGKPETPPTELGSFHSMARFRTISLNVCVAEGWGSGQHKKQAWARYPLARCLLDTGVVRGLPTIPKHDFHQLHRNAMTQPRNTGGSAGRAHSEAIATGRERVVAALRGVEQGERESLDKLRSAICEFISALRTVGTAREEVASIVADLIKTPGDPEGGTRLPGPAREALVELSLHWCAEELKKGR